ncbi:hypothetical protein EL23_18095 [Paenibacillus polymyxa]|nr:hypothetical protein EL23_18095 [Paenibacillus polymyxa]
MTHRFLSSFLSVLMSIIHTIVHPFILSVPSYESLAKHRYKYERNKRHNQGAKKSLISPDFNCSAMNSKRLSPTNIAGDNLGSNSIMFKVC